MAEKTYVRIKLMPMYPVAEFTDPCLGDKVNSGIRVVEPARRPCSLACRYNNPIAGLTLSPSQRFMNSATGDKKENKYARVARKRQVCKRYREETKCKGHGEEQSIRKRFKVEKSMQGLRIRAEKSNVAEQNECAKATEENRVCKRSKVEKRMQGRQSRAEYASIIEKNRVYMGCTIEQSMQF